MKLGKEHKPRRRNRHSLLSNLFSKTKLARIGNDTHPSNGYG